MRSYLTIDFLISLGMFFTTIIVLSHIIKPITPNQGKMIVKNSEHGTSKFFKNLSQDYTNVTNNIIFNYSMAGYNPYSLSFKWYTLCTLYNTTKTAICANPPCPVQFYGNTGTPYTNSIPSYAVPLGSSDIISKYYLPMVGFLMPVDQNGNNFATPYFSKTDLRFYNKSAVYDVLFNCTFVRRGRTVIQPCLLNTPRSRSFKLSLTYLTTDVADAINELNHTETGLNGIRICRKYGCVLYERITFKAQTGVGYFIYVNQCHGYCMVFFNGIPIGSIAPYTGMYLPNIWFTGLRNYTIVVASIIDKQPELPYVSFKVYEVPASSLAPVYKCLSEYLKSNKNSLIVFKPTEIVLNPEGTYPFTHAISTTVNLTTYKIVQDKRSNNEIFVNKEPFYSVYLNTKGWKNTTKPNIYIPNTGPSNGCSNAYTGRCSASEEFVEYKACKESIKLLENPSRISVANDLLARITFMNLIYSHTWFYSNRIREVVLLFRSDDGASVWFNGVGLLNRVHDNHPAYKSLYGVIITPSNYTKLWYINYPSYEPPVYGTKVLGSPGLFKPGKNVLAIWVANGGDENWGCGSGGLYIKMLRIYEDLEF